MKIVHQKTASWFTLALLGIFSLTGLARAQTPVALFNCEEGSGSTLVNSGSLGTAKNATIAGTAAWSADSVIGTHALSLNGSTSAQVSGALVNGAASFTAASWVKLNALGAYGGILSIDGTNVSGFFLEYSGDARKFDFARFASDSTSSAVSAAVSTASPVAGTWYHVAGVYDASAKTLALYVNGVLQQSVAYTTTWAATGNTLIGRTKWGGNALSYLNGLVDDVRLYNSALTAAQIQTLFNLRSTPAATPTAITPYVQINGGAWAQTASATVAAGGSVKFGPQPVSGGSWSWSGPNSFSATAREVTLSNIASNQAGIYTATYTNASGAKSTQAFTVTVTGTTSFSLTIGTTGSGSTNPAAGTQSYTSGTVVSVTATASSGYTFSGWSGAATGTANPISITVDANKTLTATFTAVTYTLTINTSGNGSTSPVAGTYSYPAGTAVSVTATAGSDSSFSGWTGAANSNSNPVSLTMDANKTLTASFVVNGGGGASFYTWPTYSPTLAYDYVTEYGTINPPTTVANDVTGVAGTYADGWWCFRYGANKNALVTAAAWVPMIAHYNTDFSYISDVMRWPRDSRARAGNYSAVYLYGSGLSTDTASNTATGGWQSWAGNGPIVLASYYPVYCFDPACPYGDRTSQQGAMTHEGIHCILASMPGCKNAAWFQEGGNTWLQGTMESQRTNDFSSIGWLSAGEAIAPFMPIECYSGWLQDDSFGGPSAERVNMFNGSQQICTWKKLLGGTQYGECFPHAMEVMLGFKSVAWVWRYCSASGRVLQDMAEVPGGLGATQTRRLIQEFRGRQAMCDFGRWSGAIKQLLLDNWKVAIGPEWSPYWINCPVWTSTCYVATTQTDSTLTPETRTLPGWSGANQIPLTVSGTTATVTFNPTGANMSCQLVYRDTSGNIRYSTPVSSGTCSIPLSNVKNNVVIAVICNTNYTYDGGTTKYGYTLTLGSGVTGKADIYTQWFN